MLVVSSHNLYLGRRSSRPKRPTPAANTPFSGQPEERRVSSRGRLLKERVCGGGDEAPAGRASELEQRGASVMSIVIINKK